VPADGTGFEQALASAADAILMSVADSRVPAIEQRTRARDAFARIAESGKTPLVMVNYPRTRILRDDVEAVLVPGLAGVFLSHTVQPQDVRDLGALLREFELARGIEPGTITVFPVIDAARGLLRAAEIVDAAPRVGGLVFAAERYAHDVGARHEESGPRLSYARGAVVAAARAFGLLPLVQASSLQLREMAQYGFGGAVLSEPGAAAAANAAFTPPAVDLERAKSVVDAYDAARAEGAWVVRVGEEVIDAPEARKARQSLELQ
ncbi:MAG TPA: aldolase/citrate lyase family protein, partial [Tepidiformaceae bacterium]|nr:aldolase/citrate lyase family protein [Tepidiformaceae bacterium]